MINVFIKTKYRNGNNIRNTKVFDISSDITSRKEMIVQIANKEVEMRMKIDGLNYTQLINKLYKKDINQKFEKREDTQETKDRIELSKTSKDVKKYIEKMKYIETGNKDKIERIKEALDQGTYQVSSKDLAQIIVNKMNQQKGEGEK